VERVGDVTWSLADRQGSIVDLVDENGTVVNHFVYDSFGGRTATTGVDFRFGYTGRELDDETGLYYYRARYYDAGLGRFISQDPIGFTAGDTNLYRYVNNSPTNATDPMGEVANVAAGAGFGAVFGGLYALAHDLETGNFGWGTFGNVARGAAVGAAVGAAASIGLAAATNVLAAGFQAVLGANTALGVATAGAIVDTSIAAGFAGVAAYNAGGNFGRGKYLTGTLDLVGAGLGAKNVFSGVTQGIPNARWTDLANAIDNLPMPGTPRQLNSSGAIVPAGSSALATRTSVGGAIVPYGNNAGGAAIVPAAGSAIFQATSPTTDPSRLLAGGTDNSVTGLITYEDVRRLRNLQWNLSRPGVSNSKFRQQIQNGVKTIGFADVDVDGEVFVINGYSGGTKKIQQVDGYAHYKDTHQLGSTYANNNGKITGDGTNRMADAEKNILEGLLLRTTSSSVGNVRLVVNRITCDSCGIIAIPHFRFLRPGIKLEVVFLDSTNNIGRYRAPIPPK
jgi:RHS repeat-associated protein